MELCDIMSKNRKGYSVKELYRGLRREIMKKLALLCCCLIAVLVFGCGTPSEVPEEKCAHGSYEKGSERYVKGKTCNDPLTKYAICNDCGEEVRVGKVESRWKCTSDSAKKPEVVKKATCTEEGISQWTCIECGAVRQFVVEKIEHQYLHFFEEDTPRCVGCGMNAPQIPVDHVHEYECTWMDEYRNEIFNHYVGGRNYKCKECDASYSECFDEHGVFDAEAVLRKLQKEARDMGYVVVLDEGVFPFNGDGQRLYSAISFKDTSSFEYVSDLTELGKKLLQSALDYYSPASDVYMYIRVDSDFDWATTYFRVELYFIGRDYYNESVMR